MPTGLSTTPSIQRQPSRLSLLALAISVACLSGALVSASVIAADNNLLVAQTQTEPTHFDIAPGPMASVLKRFASTAGITLSFDPAQVEGINSQGLQGQHNLEQAMEILLAGTELHVRRTSSGGYMVTLPREESGEVLLLPSMTVIESRLYEDAYGPVQGIAATRSATGTKTDTPIIETPQSISVISRKEMDMRNVRDVGDAVSYTSGISAGSTGETTLFGGNNIRVRGYGGSGSAGSSFNEYLDGLKLQGTSFASSNLDPWLFERVEVLKGPASVLFGQTQPGGIVNMVSKRPHADMINEVRLGTGNFDEASAAFDLGSTSGDQWLFRVVGLGLRGKTQQDHSKRERQLLAPSLRWTDGTTDITLLAHYQRDDINASILSTLPRDGLFSNPNGRAPLSFRVGDPGFEHWDRETWSLGYLFNHQFSDALTFRQNLRFTNNKLDSNWLYRRSLEPDQRTLQRSAFSAKDNSDDLTIDNQLELKFDTGALEHTLLAGVDYQHLSSDTLRGFESSGVPSIDLFNPIYNQYIPEPPIYQHNATKIEQLGFYLQDQIKIGSLSLLAGIRYDDAKNTAENKLNSTASRESDDEITARVGVIYNFAMGIAPYASYSESFQPVSGTDFYGSQFKPMKGKQYEVGVKYQPPGTDHLVTLSAFDLTQENMTTADPVNAGFRIQTGEVQTRGVELETKVGLNDNLNVVAAYTYLDDEVTKSNSGDQGNRRPQIPKQTASLWANYSLSSGPLSGVGAGMGVRYMGETEGDSGNTFSVPSYTLVDLAGHYDLEKSTFGLTGWYASFNVNNLFDKYYVASCSALSTCHLGQGRELRASVAYNW